MAASFDILGRRADGRGTIHLETGVPVETIALIRAARTFGADQSLTMVWVVARDGRADAIEVFTR